jgi:hypothetical protein
VKLLLRLSIASIFFLTAVTAMARTGMSLSGGIGVPRGYMDVMGTLSSGYRFDPVWRVQPDGSISVSFTAKGDGSGGRLTQIALSGYLLARYSVPVQKDRVEGFIAPGFGCHYLMSSSSAYSTLRSTRYDIFLIKSHIFAGIDFGFASNLTATVAVRTTFPSDIVFDVFYLTIRRWF